VNEAPPSNHNPDLPTTPAGEPLPQTPPAAARRAAEREWVDYSGEMTISRYRALRVVFRAMGVGAIGLGVLGYLLPGLPGTVFFLIAAWAFGQSSPRFYNWLMNHRQFGPLIRDYRAGKGIPLWVKVYAPVMIVTFSGWSAYRLGVVREKPWIAVSILAFAAYGVWYVLRVPVKKRD